MTLTPDTNTMQHYTFYQLLGMSLLAFFMGACGQPSSSTDWQRSGLKGNVQQLEEWHYSSYQDFLNQQYSRHQEFWFSNKGFLTKEVAYQSNNRLWWSYYHYQSDSVWIRKTLQTEGGKERNQSFWLYELDERGEQKVVTSLLLDTSVYYKLTVQFNEEHLPVEYIYSEQREPQKVPCRVVKQYNKKKQVQRETAYGFNPATQQCNPTPHISTFTYNEQGHVKRETINYANGTQGNFSYQYQYDSIGNWTNCLYYEGDQVIEVTKRALYYYE